MRDRPKTDSKTGFQTGPRQTVRQDVRQAQDRQSDRIWDRPKKDIQTGCETGTRQTGCETGTRQTVRQDVSQAQDRESDRMWDRPKTDSQKTGETEGQKVSKKAGQSGHFIERRWIQSKLGSLDRSLLKEASRRVFRKFARPPSSESPLKYESAPYFSPANYAINLDSCREYSLRIQATFGHWKKKKLRHFLTPLRNLQRRAAFIAPFTSEKWKMTIEKCLFRLWPLKMIFFIARL